jgi:alpha-tubulin suppressor-like RCC1 family protein
MNTFVLTPQYRLYSYGGYSACLGREQNFDEDTKEMGEVIVGVKERELIKKIATGKSHVLALTESGRVYAWGKNDKGQLGIGEKGE